MTILLPLTAKVEERGKLANLDKVRVWAFVDLSEGKIQKIDYFEDRHEYTQWIDVVVVASKDDYIWPFIEESIAVLEAPIQREVDDVIEAFLFKELYEVIN